MVIPGAEYAVIGGSGTFKICFPEELHLNGVEVSGEDLVFDTPMVKVHRLNYYKWREKMGVVSRYSPAKCTGGDRELREGSHPSRYSGYCVKPG